MRAIVVVGVVAGAVVTLRLTLLRPTLVPVTVVRVETGVVEEVVTNNRAGTVTARRQAALSPEVGGRVVRLPVQEGDPVRKGDLLLALADADLRGQIALQQQSLEAARASVREACATADLAARDLERLKTLLADGFVSRQAVDQAENQQVTASSACAAAGARVAQAGAAVDVARATLSKTVLLAPFDGIVSKVSTHLGEWVSPSPAGLPMPPALELIDTRSIYVRAPLDEVDAGRIRPGLAARITMDAFPGKSFPGRVIRSAAYVSEEQRQNRTFDVEVSFEDAGVARTLLPGTSADLEIILRARDAVPRLPTAAILQGNRVLVVRDGTLVAVPIQTGLANWEFTEITAGVRPGDAVVISLDRQEVHEGARARIERETVK